MDIFRLTTNARFRGVFVNLVTKLTDIVDDFTGTVRGYQLLGKAPQVYRPFIQEPTINSTILAKVGIMRPRLLKVVIVEVDGDPASVPRFGLRSLTCDYPDGCIRMGIGVPCGGYRDWVYRVPFRSSIRI